MDCVRPCRLTCSPDETPSLFGTAAESPRYHPKPVPTNVTSSKKQATIVPRDFALPIHPLGRMHTPGGLCRYPHICCLHNQPSEAECVRQNIIKQMPCDLKFPVRNTRPGAYNCSSDTGLLTAAATPLAPAYGGGVLRNASTMDISCCYSLPTVMLHRWALVTTALVYSSSVCSLKTTSPPQHHLRVKRQLA